MEIEKKSTKGGRRPGAGRKLKQSTILKRLAIEKAGDEAEKSLQFCVDLRNDEYEPKSLRFAAAQEIMDRVWGKSKQQIESPAFSEIIDLMRKKYS